jgi:hypothetical protein
VRGDNKGYAFPGKSVLSRLEETKYVFAPLLGHGKDKLLGADFSPWIVILH